MIVTTSGGIVGGDRLRFSVDAGIATEATVTTQAAEKIYRSAGDDSEIASINLAAVADMNSKFPALDLVIIESGGDNLAATFSPELADITIYVIDVSAGDKIPRKGGPGITRSDLLVINKIDLAPLVGADLDVMDRDSRKMRGDKPFIFSNIKAGKGVSEIADLIVETGGL